MSLITARGESIPVDERECYLDAEWALHDPDVQERYAGQWVVAHGRQIIAHGTGVRQPLADAAHLVPGRAHRVIYCAPEDPSTWLEHVLETDPEFSHD
jgi:hypothetical protein